MQVRIFQWQNRPAQKIFKECRLGVFDEGAFKLKTPSVLQLTRKNLEVTL